MALETVLSPRRRGWILLTAVATTIMFSWASINRLGELVEVQQLPSDVASHSLLELTEQNIASHLHLPHTDAFRGGAVKQDEAGDDASEEEVRPGVSAGGGGGATPAAKVAVDKSPAAGAVAGKQQPAAQSTKGAASGGGQAQTRAKPAVSPKPKPTGKATPAGGAGLGGQRPCKAHKIMNHTDFWGDALVWGSSHKVTTAEECCRRCGDYKPKGEDGWACNVWVYCEDRALCGANHRECWLKHLSHPHGVTPAKEGPQVGWTTGVMDAPPGAAAGGAQAGAALEGESSDDRRYHVVISAQGPATHWQSRVGYYWYKKIKARCEAEGNCQMGGFTRILHEGGEDDLMGEMNTYVAEQLPAEHPHHGYIVLNRPWAFMQWVRDVTIPEKYVLMSEPDHVWLKPMPNLMAGRRPAAFPFFYIEPSKAEYFGIVKRFLGNVSRADTEHVAPIGSAPTLLSWDDMRAVAPLWFNLSIAVHNDEEAVKEWGWVQEMYAFTLALYQAGVRDVGLHPKLMSQPPWDTEMEPYYILHYTYGMDYTLEGEFTPGKYGDWRFDKRSFHSLPPPRNLEEPPPGMQNHLVRHLIHAINEATSVIPGWDDYAKTGRVTQLWDGVLPEEEAV